MSMFKKSVREHTPLITKQMLVFAVPGAGKSTLAAGISKCGHKAIYVDIEQGLDGNFTDLPVLCPFNEDGTIAPWTWPKVEEAVATALASDAQVIVVDSWSKAYNLCRDHVMALKGWTTEDDGGSHGKGYGVIRAEFYRVFKPLLNLKAAGRTAVILTHAKERRVEKTATQAAFQYLDPAIEGPAGNDCERIFDLILCYESEKTKSGDRYVLYTKNDGYHTAKDRTGYLPARIVFPQFEGDNDQIAAQTWEFLTQQYDKGAGK